ncbi:Uncharacterised protein [Oligella ureolytica]|uniref:Uncharacterized protein n=1 Tax=Oligella ureolytica TaxID=90244 RepID=A0A378XGM3_9BURK|nr:Uncharacterised protein [Oligella ureolytica]
MQENKLYFRKFEGLLQRSHLKQMYAELSLTSQLQEEIIKKL